MALFALRQGVEVGLQLVSTGGEDLAGVEKVPGAGGVKTDGMMWESREWAGAPSHSLEL